MRFSNSVRRGTLLATLILLLIPRVSAFDTFGFSWPSGEVPIVLDLDNADAPLRPPALIDGSTTWNQVGRNSVAAWNEHLGRVQLVAVEPTAGQTAGRVNGVNEAVFSETIFGDEFGDTTLAVTLLSRQSTNFSATGEADIVVKKDREWNSYRGDLRDRIVDLQRVFTHELGHFLGLDHPDQATPPQTVNAIMNAVVGNIDSLQADDIAGVDQLYGTELVTPGVVSTQRNISVNVGEIVTLSMQIEGEPGVVQGGDNLTLDWFYPDVTLENFLFIEDKSDLFVGLAQTYDSGRYTLFAQNPDGSATDSVLLTVNPIPTSPQTQLSNLSTRGFSGSGERAMTVGFVIGGAEPLTVMLRAVGPTLAGAPFNVGGTMTDPVLSLRKQVDGSFVDVATNDNWHTSDLATAQEIRNTAADLGAFALSENSADAVLLITLDPGIYTATVTGAGETGTDEGVILVEAYDVETKQTDSRLTNLSTRGFVTNDATTMIAGLVVKGEQARTYLLRAVGDTLGDFNVGNTVDDPLMKLFRGNDEVRINDDWDHPPVHQEMLRQMMSDLGAFALTDRQECAMLLTLQPGAYTLRVEGFDENSEGVGLIEFYEVPE